MPIDDARLDKIDLPPRLSQLPIRVKADMLAREQLEDRGSKPEQFPVERGSSSPLPEPTMDLTATMPLRIPKAIPKARVDLGFQPRDDVEVTMNLTTTALGGSRIPRPSQLSPLRPTRSSSAPVEASPRLPELYHNHDDEVPMEMTVPMTANPTSTGNGMSSPQADTRHQEVAMEETVHQRVELAHDEEIPMEETQYHQVPMEETQHQQVPMEETQFQQRVSTEETQHQQVPMEQTQYQEAPMEETQYQQQPTQKKTHYPVETQYLQAPMELTQHYQATTDTNTPSTSTQPRSENPNQPQPSALEPEAHVQQLPSTSPLKPAVQDEQQQSASQTEAQTEEPMEMTQNIPAKPASIEADASKAQADPPLEAAPINSTQEEAPMEITEVHQPARQIPTTTTNTNDTTTEQPANAGSSAPPVPVTEHYSEQYEHVEISQVKGVYTEDTRYREVTMEFTQFKSTTSKGVEPLRPDDVPMDFTEPLSTSIAKVPLQGAKPGSTEPTTNPSPLSQDDGVPMDLTQLASVKQSQQQPREPLAPLSLPENSTNADDDNHQNKGDSSGDTEVPMDQTEPVATQRIEPLQEPVTTQENEEPMEMTQHAVSSNLNNQESGPAKDAAAEEASISNDKPQDVQPTQEAGTTLDPVVESPPSISTQDSQPFVSQPSRTESEAQVSSQSVVDTSEAHAEQTFPDYNGPLSPDLYHTPSALPLKYTESPHDGLPMTPRAPLTPKEVLLAPPEHYIAEHNDEATDEYSLYLSQDAQMMDSVAQEYIGGRPQPIRGYQLSVLAQDFFVHVRDRGAEHMETLYEVTEVSESDNTLMVPISRESILSPIKEPVAVTELAQPSQDDTDDFIPTLSTPNLSYINPLITGSDNEVSKAIDELKRVVDESTLREVGGKVGLDDNAHNAILWALSWSITPDGERVIIRGSTRWIADIIDNVKENLRQVSDYYANGASTEADEFDEMVYQVAQAKVTGAMKRWQRRAIMVMAAFAKVERAQQWIIGELEQVERTKEEALHQLERFVDGAEAKMAANDDNKENEVEVGTATPDVVEEASSEAPVGESSVMEVDGNVVDNVEDKDDNDIANVSESMTVPTSTSAQKEPEMVHLTPRHDNQPRLVTQPSQPLNEDQRFWLSSQASPLKSPLPVPPQKSPQPLQSSVSVTDDINGFVDIDGFVASYADEMMVTGVVDRHLNVTLTRHNLSATVAESMVWRYGQMEEAVPYLLRHVNDTKAATAPLEKLAHLVRLWRSLCRLDRELGFIDITTRVAMVEVADDGIFAGLIHLNRHGKTEIHMVMPWAGLEAYRCQVTTEVVRGAFGGWQPWSEPNHLFHELGRAIASSISS